MVRSKSPARIEPRVDREASAIAKAGHEVHVLLWDRELKYQQEEAQDSYVIRRFHQAAPEGQIGLLPNMFKWWFWEFRMLFKTNPDVVHACDFDTVIPATFYCVLKGKRLLYDIFDFYAYMIAQPLGSITRNLIARVERYFAKRADLVILPDRARVVQLGSTFSGRIKEIMNVPEEVKLKEKEEREFSVFYGGMISHERGLRQLVEATRMAGVKLIVAGHGADEAKFVPIFHQNKHVSFLGNIPYEEVLKWSARCHLIAALYDPTIPNNRLASPNKLFEAMMFGKPIVTTEGTRPADIVHSVGCGVVVKYDDVLGLAEVIRNMAFDSYEREQMGEKGRKAFKEKYNWTIMEKRLASVYASL